VGLKNERGLPQSLDYFVCDSKYQKYFIDEYGDKPDSIQICFISNEFKDSCDERYECRDKDGRLAGYGDGEVTFIYNGKEYVKSEDRKAIASAGKWEIILTIKFVIPKIKGIFGLFSFSTKGDKSSLPQIRNTFDTVLEQAGTVINIPFDLMVKKVKSQKPGTKHLFPVVNLIPNLSKDNLEIVHNYLEMGNDIKRIGLLDENKVKLLNHAKEKIN
jgi:Recombination directionality factor-like